MAEDSDPALTALLRSAGTLPRKQSVSDRIDDLADWLKIPAPLREDASGALAVLAGIKADHAELMAAVQGALAEYQSYLTSGEGPRAFIPSMERLREAAANVS